MITAVLFDLDGTILDRSVSLAAFIEWQIENDLKDQKLDPIAFRHRFIELDDNGQVWKDKVYQTLVREFGITSVSEHDLLASYVTNFANHCVPMAGVIDQIQQLHSSGLQLGLVSNGPSPFQERNFEALGVAELFSAVIVSGACGLRKPDTSIFELAASTLGVTASECVFVGDNPVVDIDGANDAGMYSVFVPGPFGLHCDSANYVLTDLNDLMKAVESAS